MEGILQKLFELSMQAGCLILVVLGIRLVFRKIPRSVVCFLWMLVGLRLIVPISLESDFSLIPEFSGVEQLFFAAVSNDEWENLPGDYSNVNDLTEGQNINMLLPGNINGQVIGGLQTDAASADLSDTKGDTTDQEVNGVSAALPGKQLFGANEMGDDTGTAWEAGTILFVVWLLGSAVLLGYGAYSYIRIYRIVREAWHYEDNIWLCEKIESPFLLGVINPRIYIPCHIEDAQMRYIVEHERTHIARMDHISKLAGYGLLAVYWFNPLVWVAYITFCKDVELACDERTIDKLGTAEKKSYSETLLLCSMEKKFAIANPLAFGEVNVGSRIRNILNYKKPGFWVMVVSALLCIVVATCFLTSPKEDEKGREDTQISTQRGEESTENTDRIDKVQDAVLTLDAAEQIVEEVYAGFNERYYALFYSDWGSDGGKRVEGVQIGLPGYYYYNRVDEKLKTIQDIKDWIEELCDPQVAETFFYSKLFDEYGPVILEYAGELYVQYFGVRREWNVSDLVIEERSTEQIVAKVTLQSDDHEALTSILRMAVRKQEETWKITYLTWDNPDLAVEKIQAVHYEELGMEPLSTDMVIFPEATLTALPMLSTVSVDLNGDGEQELVQAGITGWDERYEDRENLQLNNRILYNSMKMPYIRINDMVFTSEYLAEKCQIFMDNPDWLHYYIADIDVNDGYREIGLAFDGPSGAPSTAFIRYDKDELVYIGSCSNTPLELENVQNNTPEEYIEILNAVGGETDFYVTIPGDGTVTASAHIWILETTYTELLWKLYDADKFRASLREETKEIYEYSLWDQGRGEFAIRAGYDFQAFSSMDENAAPVDIAEGTRIAFYRYHTDGSFIEFKYGENLEFTAWIIFKPGPVQDNTVTLPTGDCNGYELFHNLYQAG